MNDEQTRVYVATRKRSGKKPTYHLRWIDATTGRWKSEKCGTSRKEADQRAALRQSKLEDGTHWNIRHIDRNDFVVEHVTHIVSKANAEETQRTLTEFGTVRKLAELRRMSCAHVEA